jgi:hypothetical protein
LEKLLGANSRQSFEELNLPRSIAQDYDRALLKKAFLELKKPERERFAPNPEFVIRAARDQLGLEMVPDRRPMKVLSVTSR